MGAKVYKGFPAGVLALFAFAWAGLAAADLRAFLPSATEIPGWQVEGAPQEAEGEALFALINGGAEVFLRHGFVRAVLQVYVRSDQALLHVEIYQMAGEEGARRVLAEQGGGRGASVGVGAEGVRGDHYLVFREGRYLVSVAGPDASSESQAAVLAAARAIASGLHEVNP
jgi:hypothetical protein